MPVAKKPTRRPNSSDRQAIKDLVRDLPSLIMQESEQATAVPITHVAATKRPIVVHSNPRQRRWVWIGVALCTLVIGAFWVYNMQSLVVRTFDGRSVEKDIANSTTQDLQALLNTVMINNEKLRLATSSTAQTTGTAPSEEALRAALLATLSTSTTATSTTKTTTTTN